MADVPTVLIVDDDVVLARAFAQALNGEGFRADAVNSAEDALHRVRHEPPDAIILDFRMPMINGVGFLYRLRAQSPTRHIPVLVVTGEAMLSDEVLAELHELGADVRQKPIGLHEFLSATRTLLTRAPGALRVN
jgi:DNA-binding response OmpR family regulator